MHVAGDKLQRQQILSPSLVLQSKGRQLHGEHADHFEAAMLERPGARRLRMYLEERQLPRKRCDGAPPRTRSI
jgi:hypothetical protein